MNTEETSVTQVPETRVRGGGDFSVARNGAGQPAKEKLLTLAALPSPEAVAQALQSWERARACAKSDADSGKASGKAGRKIGPGQGDLPPWRAANPAAPDANYPLKEKPIPRSFISPMIPENGSGGGFEQLVVEAGQRLGGEGRVVLCAGLLAAALLVGWFDRGTLLRHGSKIQVGMHTPSPAWQVLSTSEWFQRAQESAEAGNFRRALGTVKYALAGNPNNAALLAFEGDMHQSLFQFPEAQAAYSTALRLDADNEAARQNLLLSRRLGRYRFDAAAHPSSLYGLHRVMLSQRRISEAIAITRRLPGDRELCRSTWQAALDQTGLCGKVSLEEDGSLALDLAGSRQPDLSLIREFPVSRLNLADTGLEEIGALRGMPLRHLDLSRTLVHNLTPLSEMPLEGLVVRGTGVVELSAVARCPLRELDISNTKMGDLSALGNLSLQTLRAENTPVADLGPLATLPLKNLYLSRTRVKDLRPLGNLGLHVLTLDGTGVSDLAALRGCPLRELSLCSTGVRDLSPLREMPLKVLSLSGCAGGLDLRPLTTCQDLEHLTVPARSLSMEALARLPHLHSIEQPAT